MDVPEQASVDALLSLHGAGKLLRMDVVPEPGPRLTLELQSSAGAYTLTVHPTRPFWSLVHEKDLTLWLAHAQDALGGVAVPQPVKNAAGGYLFPMESRFAVVSHAPKGRRVAPFEISAALCAQAGRLLGHFHVLTRGYHGHQRWPLRMPTLRRWMRVFPKGDSEQAALVRQVLDALLPFQRQGALPAGCLHGNLGPAAVRIWDGALCSLLELGSASRGPLAADVATSLLTWCVDGQGVHGERWGALLEAYESVRPLRPVERRSLPVLSVHAAAVQLAGCLRDHVFGQRVDAVRGHMEPRHAQARLAAVQAVSRHGWRGLLGRGAT